SSGCVDAVAEGEEGVRRHHRAADHEAFVRRLDAGDARTVDAAHLASTDADGTAFAAVDDGIALHELHHLPGELQVFQLLRRGGALGDHFQVGCGHRAIVTVLHQQAADHAAIVP